ncbi:MAG: outer membrane protein transport protein [Elusimicrobiales bacterium]|nr:outer membrane protein transport protein [Elusimicrobiales bacterium]
MKQLAILIVTIMAANAGAAGFRQANQGAAANGMGNAFTAVANDATAVWYNPAAITDLPGTNVTLGSVFVAPVTSHKQGAVIDEPESKVHPLPHFYATRKLNEKWAIGVGVNPPYGLSTEWDKTNSLTREVATESALKAIYTNINGAYKVNENLSVSLGASFVYLDATMNKKIEFAGNNIEQTLEGDGTSGGWNLAAMYKWNKWNFAANYRSLVKVGIDGKINLPTSGALAVSKPTATNQTGRTTITLPDTLQIGTAYKPNDSWTFSAEADYTNWTTYRKLVIDYKQDDGNWNKTTETKNWRSVWAFRVGGEHKLNENWKLRAGAYYDLSPISNSYFETRNPGSDRLAFSIGAGWTKGNLTVDASYLYLKFIERTINDSLQDNGVPVTAGTELNGTYNTVARLPAISASYKF